MQPTKLTLTNYAAAGTVTVDLSTGGAIGFIGENGTGKSSTIDAVRMAYTGTTSKTNIAKIQSWGSNGNTASTALEGILRDGSNIRIHRNIVTNTKGKASGKASITINGEIVASTPTQAATWLENYGLSRDIVLKNMIVEQGDLDKILFTEPAVRYKSWVRMCGLEYLSKAHETTGKFLTDLPALSDYTLMLETAGEAIEAANARLQAAETAAAGLTDPGTVGAELKVQWSELVRATASMESTKLKQSTAHQDAVDLEQTLAAAAPPEQSTVDALIAEGAKLQEQLNTSTQLMSNYNRFTAAKEALTKCPPGPTESYIDEVQAKADKAELNLGEMRKAQSTIATQLAELEVAINATHKAATETHCPTCGQEVKAAEKAKADYAAAVAKRDGIRPKEVQLATMIESTVKDITTLKAEVTGATHANMLHANAVHALEAATAANTLDAPINVQDLQLRLDTTRKDTTAAQQGISNYAALNTSLTTKRANVQVLDAALEADVAKVAELTASITALGFDPTQDLSTKHQELSALEFTYTQAQVELQSAKEDLVRSKKSKDQAQANIDGQAAEQLKRDTLLNVKEQLHNTQLPMRIVGSILEKCTSTVNKFLEDFDALYRVESDVEQMSFRYFYLDGRDVGTDGALPSIIELSGGEKCIMACAFRFATYVMFSRDSGLLVLDEPTAYLDATHVSKFAQIIPKLKRTAESLGTKLVMATHERACIPFMDSIVDFGEK